MISAPSPSNVCVCLWWSRDLRLRGKHTGFVWIIWHKTLANICFNAPDVKEGILSMTDQALPACRSPPVVGLNVPLNKSWMVQVQQCHGRKMSNALTTLLWGIMIDYSSLKRFSRRPSPCTKLVLGSRQSNISHGDVLKQTVACRSG